MMMQLKFIHRKKGDFIRGFGDKYTYTIYYRGKNKLHVKIRNWDKWYNTDSIDNSKEIINAIESGQKTMNFYFFNSLKFQMVLFIIGLFTSATLIAFILKAVGIFEPH